jgi:hypothetical protein
VQIARQCGDVAGLEGLEPGAHVCAVIDSDELFETNTIQCLAEGARLGQKPFRFSPRPGATATGGMDVTVVDPTHAFLHGGPLVPSIMLSMFDRQTEQARREGYTGIRLVADMDWMLAHPPAPQDIAAFELLLDKTVTELGATVVCAYRRAHFAAGLAEVAAVHPLHSGVVGPGCSFRFFHTGAGAWQLTGEIDIFSEDAFWRACVTAADTAPVTRLNCRGLTFASAAGLGLISRLARTPHPHPMVIQDASDIVQRCWKLLVLEAQVTFETTPEVARTAAVAGRHAQARGGDQ